MEVVSLLTSRNISKQNVNKQLIEFIYTFVRHIASTGNINVTNIQWKRLTLQFHDNMVFRVHGAKTHSTELRIYIL